MTERRLLTTLVALLLVGAGSGSNAETDAARANADLAERVAQLERQLEAVHERIDAQDGGPAGDWTERLEVSGNADFSYLRGQDNAIAENGRHAVENARLFFDFDLAGETNLLGGTAFRSVSFFLEWDLIRNFEMENQVGSAHARFDGLFGRRWLNARIGRMPIPFGEEYLRFHQQRPENPLISFSALSPYNWDEGLMLFGASPEGRFEYAVTVMDGDAYLNENRHSDASLNAKLTWNASAWAKFSVSGIRTGRVYKSAIEWGGTHGMPVGSDQRPVFQDGVAVAADPSKLLDDLVAVEIDAIIERDGLGRLWVAAGQIDADSATDSSYDRKLAYWIVEGVVEFGAFSQILERFYGAIRWSGIGTFDRDEGYLLEAMNQGGDLGFNARSVEALSGGIGIRLTPGLTLKTEYTWMDFDLVRGAEPSFGRAAGDRNYFGAGLSLSF